MGADDSCHPRGRPSRVIRCRTRPGRPFAAIRAGPHGPGQTPSGVPMRLLMLLLLTTAMTAGEAVLSFHDEGLRIDAGTVGGLTMEWPEMTGGDKAFKPTSKRHQGGTATLTYP